MGLCFSKKKPPAKPGKIAVSVSDDKAKKKPAQQQPKRAAANKQAAVFVVRPGSAKDAAAAAAPGEEKRKQQRPGSQEPAPKQPPVVLLPSAPVRTSSCTKEEVDAILIQCGRLSRSSSGTGRATTASGETGTGGGHRRRRSVSKRSYDLDQEARSGGGGADEECDWEEERPGASAVSRPSPQHRGSPQRKRSGSRERTGSGSRRASRSPGRRGGDGAAATSVATAAGSGGGGDRARQQQQPGKMVSVPAREKGRAPSPSPAAAAASGKRCASPRSSSPARMAAGNNENAGGGPAAGPTPVLSRSSSRKNEQSPYRRNPLADLDDNSLRNSGAKLQKKSTETAAVAATPKKKATATGRGKEPPPAVPSSCSGKEKQDAPAVAVAASETRAHSSTRTVSVVADSLTTQRPSSGAQPGCRSRRASRDLDQNPGSYYTTQLLEDIHNYHQQSSTSATPVATSSLSLPACVAKACSIVEAVADLNSSSSENRTYEHDEPGGRSADDKGSVNARAHAAAAGSDGGFVEPGSGAARKHLLPVRDVLAAAETEPQESAGSNSVSGHPWTPSWEPTSVESTDRTWSAGDEVVEQSAGSHGGGGGRCSPMNNRPRQSKQRQSQHEPSGGGGRSRAGCSGNDNSQYHRGRSAHRGSGSVASGRSGVRVVSANS